MYLQDVDMKWLGQHTSPYEDVAKVTKHLFQTAASLESAARLRVQTTVINWVSFSAVLCTGIFK